MGQELQDGRKHRNNYSLLVNLSGFRRMTTLLAPSPRHPFAKADRRLHIHDLTTILKLRLNAEAEQKLRSVPTHLPPAPGGLLRARC